MSLSLLLGALGLTLGCSREPETPTSAFAELRRDAERSRDPEVVADWLLAELLRPGGDPKQALRARRRLDELKAEGMTAEVARGLDDLAHGRLRGASEEFFDALVAAQGSDDPRAPLLAWYAAQQTAELSGQNPGFGARHAHEFERLLAEPGAIGFRAYATVVDLWADEAWQNATADVDEKLVDRLGCVRDVRLAGPFGTEPTTDGLRSFPAEAPGPWPVRFPSERPTVTPHQLETLRVGCDVQADEPVPAGAFYAESYLELDAPTDLVLTASGATQVWVDDTQVLERDVRVWGIWPKFGVRLTLTPGRHRVLWKLSEPGTALRLVRPDGQPLRIRSSTDPAPGYMVAAPQLGPDPNVLMRFIRPDGVEDPGGDLERYLAAYLADHEGQSDVATVLFEPFVEDAAIATGLVLSTAAGFVVGDPIYDANQTRELAHELQVRAAERDPGMWYPRLQNALWVGQQKGPNESVGELEKLVAQFPEVAGLHSALARTYEQLGWGPELARTVRRLAEQFPEDSDAVELGIALFDEEGETKKVDELLERLRHIDPDSEVFVGRALARRDYEGALRELRRLEARRPSRKDLAGRIEDVSVRAGGLERTFAQLEAAVLREPRDVHARLALGDAQLASGKKDALARALVDTVLAGGDPSLIEEAIDLVEGITELEPFRLDARQVIAEYERSGQHQAGTAARVLDYGAVLVRADGSSRFLEHEVVRIQSEEGIKQFAEMDAGGLVLHHRVLKKDGTVLEPEQVGGKDTVTMPHLELGDYIEQERILTRWGQGVGEEYLGPAWFFREPNVAYARSEFVLVTPKDQPLVLEAENGVPAPTVSEYGSYAVRRYRVDQSPAAPVEPSSPPAAEFLPRVAVGWNVSFDRRIRDAARSTIDTSAVDPRIRRVAAKIVAGQGKSADARARALYRWVLDSVQQGEESDGRRVVVSRSGSLWAAFTTLCAAQGIPVRWALAESRLSSPILSELGSAQRPLEPLLVVGSGAGRTWLTIDDKFAPYGTVPAQLRGQPAYLLGALEAERTTVPASGAEDAIRYEGTGLLRADGSAKLTLRIVFVGKFAASLRNGLSQLPEAQLAGIIESRLLGQELQGARLLRHTVLDEKKLDRPLIIEVAFVAAQDARPSGSGLLLGAPFMPSLAQLTPLATRSTPLLLTDSSAQGLDLRLALPPGLVAQVAQARGSDPRSSFRVEDQAEGGILHLVREVRTEAGRVSPADYPALQEYTRSADAALGRAVRIGPG